MLLKILSLRRGALEDLGAGIESIEVIELLRQSWFSVILYICKRNTSRLCLLERQFVSLNRKRRLKFSAETSYQIECHKRIIFWPCQHQTHFSTYHSLSIPPFPVIYNLIHTPVCRILSSHVDLRDGMLRSILILYCCLHFSRSLKGEDKCKNIFRQ